MKPKAKTYQQKLGFEDSDLKLKKHDDIMFWLDLNIEKVINNLIGTKWTKLEIQNAYEVFNERKDEMISFLKKNIDKNDNHLKLEYLLKFKEIKELPKKPSVKIQNKIWEYPIISDRNNFTIGFIDMYVYYKLPKLIIGGVKYKDTYGGSISSIDDIKIPLNWEINYTNNKLCFEVKTKIDSLGELIRQIRHYQTYKKSYYIVICPDDKYKDTLREQNIGFYKSP
jgi:hypothetical protein